MNGFFPWVEIVDFSKKWSEVFFPGAQNSGDASFYQLETKRKTFY